MPYPVALILGDGIGPEVSSATRRVLDASGVEFQWIECAAGADAVKTHGAPLPTETLDAILHTGVGLKGPLTTQVGGGFRSVNVELRQKLDLYANYRPARSFAGVKTRYDDVDLIVVRENTQGLYSGLEHIIAPGVVESLRVITESASERIVKFAFETAVQQNRRRVTAVHKANILKISDGLFLDVARRVAAAYPDIQFDEAIIDATAMKMVMDPSKFDVMVMENLFGDIISDLASGLVGGLGLTASANIGLKASVFEAVHGTAPDIAGKNKANPTALILSGVLMLRHLNEPVAADLVEAAVRRVLLEGKETTGDLGGPNGTQQYADAVIACMEKLRSGVLAAT